MPLKCAVLGLIVTLALSMAACTGASEGSEGSGLEPVSESESMSSALRDDGPTPLDRPMPSIDFHPLLPPGPPDLDLFTEPWERHPLSRRCSMGYVTIYDPANGKKIELPVTTCE